MSATTAAGAALDLLRVALHGYLGSLRAAWSAEGDVDRVLAGIAAPVRLDDVHQVAVTAALTALDAADPASDPLAWLRSRLELDRGEVLTVAAVWWAETDPQVGVALGCAHDDPSRRHATAALMRLLLAPCGIALPPEWDDAGRLVRCGVLQPGAGPDRPLRLTPTARRLLADEPPAEDVPAVTPPARLGALVRQLTAALTDGAGAVLVRGARGSGLERAVRAAVHASGRAVDDTPRPAAELRLVARLAAAVPLVPAARLADLAWTADDGPLVAVGEPADPAYGALSVDVPAATPAERGAHWTAALLAAGLAADEAVAAGRQLGARLTLPEDDADAAVAAAVALAALEDRPASLEDVWAAARRRPEHALHRVAQPVAPSYRLDDLVLPSDVRAQLDEVVAHVTLQDVVLDTWGFRRRLPRGQGVAVLLSGPSGTGKTAAAEALAVALGQDLYRVDLSAVVSKYVGETEKNLALAFEEAEHAGAVLFFDECDALFGRRTEQNDANDRWANLEVDYLLQRVETFTGLVVLATNKRGTIDEAFLRRLRFSIAFELPDASLRRALWQGVFPAPLPREDLDWDALAAREITGGTVQSSALAAAFLAAADGGTVRAEHVVHALRREYAKLGKAWTEPAAGAPR